VIKFAMILTLTLLIATASSVHAQAMGVWLFDEGAGVVAMDGSANANDGEISGQVRWTAGKFGAALAFDGGYVEVPYHPTLDANRFTMTAWVRVQRTVEPYQMILSKEAWPDRNYAMWLRPGIVTVGFTSVAGGQDIQVSGVDILDGEWHFVAGTYDGNELVTYVDGMVINTRRVGARPSLNQAPLIIGAQPPNGDSPFLGTIDEVAVYNIALSGRELDTVMEGLSEEFQAVQPEYKLATTWAELKARR